MQFRYFVRNTLAVWILPEKHLCHLEIFQDIPFLKKLFKCVEATVLHIAHIGEGKGSGSGLGDRGGGGEVGGGGGDSDGASCGSEVSGGRPMFQDVCWDQRKTLIRCCRPLYLLSLALTS